MDKNKMTRRGLLVGALSLAAAGCMPVPGQQTLSYTTARGRRATLDPRYRRQQVAFDSDLAPGSIFVDTSDRFLYFIEGGGRATRYGVGVGEEGRTLKGRATIGRKAEWPSWTPTANMMRRKPELVKYAGGVPGGPENPLGARALYLYRGGRDTMFRLHGTNEPWTIGQAVSSGCVRLLNDDIVHLYERTNVGATVVVV